ncbi:HemK2/MTQ2 family protein methyltransferase [Methanopyrus sp.]
MGVVVKDVIRYGQLKLLVFENVYSPAEDSFLLVEHQGVSGSERVLDVGTGCGIQGLSAAAEGCEVVATDVNPAAVHCAMWNSRLNGLDVDVREGDLFDPVLGERFDVVLFNPPYLPGRELPEGDPIYRATEDPVVIRRFLNGLLRGEILWDEARVVVSSLTPDECLEPLRYFEVEVVAEESLFFERVRVLALRPCE